MITPDTDLNVSLGFWPFQRFMLRTPQALADHLGELGIRRALVSAVESILYADPDVYDDACFAQLAPHPGLLPVKTINPLLPNWPDSLAAFRTRYAISAIKLFPTYHSYELSDPRVHVLMEAAAQEKLPVLIPIRVEDERQHHWCMDAPPVSVDAIVELAAQHPQTTFVVQNIYYYQMGPMADATPNVFTDFCMYEPPDSLAKLVQAIAPSQIVFGSATPYMTTEATIAKLRLGTVDDAIRHQIVATTASILD